MDVLCQGGVGMGPKGEPRNKERKTRRDPEEVLEMEGEF